MPHKVLFLGIFAALISGCGSLAPAPVARLPPSGSPEPSGSPVPAASAAVPARPQADRSEALLQALLALGIDYRPGGASPVTGFDCSGLVAHVYRQAWGLRLPQNARQQSQAGTPVGLADLQPGDLVFYDTLNRPYSHVGIYLGNGRFVHAPRSGARVRVESLRSTYWSTRFNGARRLDPAT